ncbi:MAG TPA: DegT/DnrJ/EryC1/StrS family aminotransferase [Spirochaetia bacterium]|nr:DegT/DnrJ/EryC1/StrS family aminotransferase [Spirochaetaceae bacterium]HPE88749.1 DegT/DnrJ/EryC1/StrS family aminotransferase [Spirochaetales bacterium]HRW24247.1 DegT/DnrJ/EryC1/StrS family aminotransferase [Spirochaetia bacterium]
MNPNTDFIPFARPSIGPEEEEAVLRVMRSGWLTTGAEALAFEKEFAGFVGSPRALAVNSATSGLHLALEALGIGPGDVVVTSPYTFTSSAAVVRHLGAEVVFCDVAPGSYNVDPDALGRLLATTKNCRAVIAVHVGGLPCDLRALRALADRYGCALVEDAAHAFPSKTADGYAGAIGDVGVYSFYATKTITTGEGGMLVTRDERLAARVEKMRMHGFDRAAWDRYTAKKASWRYSVVEAGFKYNLPDLLAAIGRVQLTKAERFLEERRAIAALYDEAFSGVRGLEPPPRGEGHAWHLYSLRTLPERGGVPRDDLVEALSERGVGTSVHFIPLHTMPYYAKRYGLGPEDMPNAMAMFERTVSLPIWQGMGLDAARRVADSVLAIAGARGA